jgi:hypothetical protein
LVGLGALLVAKIDFSKIIEKNIRKNNDSGTSWEARIALGGS